MTVTLENEKEFFNFIKNIESNNSKQMLLTFAHQLDLKNNKDHIIYYLNLKIELLQYTYIIFDILSIILDYCTLDHIRICGAEKSIFTRRPGMFLRIHYPTGVPYCNVYNNKYCFSYEKYSDYGSELEIINNILSNVNTRYRTNKLT
jgi:hypothetical protein